MWKISFCTLCRKASIPTLAPSQLSAHKHRKSALAPGPPAAPSISPIEPTIQTHQGVTPVMEYVHSSLISTWKVNWRNKMCWIFNITHLAWQFKRGMAFDERKEFPTSHTRPDNSNMGWCLTRERNFQHTVEHPLGAEGVLPGRQIESFLRVFKQFTLKLPRE